MHLQSLAPRLDVALFGEEIHPHATRHGFCLVARYIYCCLVCLSHSQSRMEHGAAPHKNIPAALHHVTIVNHPMNGQDTGAYGLTAHTVRRPVWTPYRHISEKREICKVGLCNRARDDTPPHQPTTAPPDDSAATGRPQVCGSL